MTKKQTDEARMQALKAIQLDPWYWAWSPQTKVKLASGAFLKRGHEFQVEPMQSQARRRVYKKGAQLGFTELEVLRTLHGMIYRRYPQGVGYFFPTQYDVSDFSRARFKPLLAANPKTIGRFVQETDAVNIKRIGDATLYLRGAGVTTKIEGMKPESPRLRSIPLDKVVFDERDLIMSEMVDLGLERLSHSEIQEEVYISTPSIPEYGIDALYDESDQRVWMIPCKGCGSETCLELEFPDCLMFRANGEVYRGCIHCRAEIYPSDGQWVARYPELSEELAGWWVSQLCSAYVSPTQVMAALNKAQKEGRLAEFYNSKLGMAYVESENKLTTSEVYACCGLDAMLLQHEGPCSMGVDVGKDLHVVIGYATGDRQRRILRVARVPTFNDVHDLASKFNVKSAVIDALPETHKVREFQKAEDYPIFLCYYSEYLPTGPEWNLDKKIMKVNRTEVCDQTHMLVVTPGSLELPRRSTEVDEYAKQMASIAKVKQEDARTGAAVYRYIKVKDDHYRHATNYFYLACQRVRPVLSKLVRHPQQEVAENAYAVLG